MIWVCALITANLLLASESSATSTTTETPGEYRIYVENDFFNPFTERTDRYYTQGLRVERLEPSTRSDEHFLPGIRHQDWCSLVCGRHARNGAVNTGYAIGQNMYTPAEITIARPQPFDRPWAGLLYGSRIARIRYEEPALRAQRQDRIEFMVGIVGPASLAKEAQIGWHRLIGSPHPSGWDNQLRNEPILQLHYETALRWPEDDGGNADFIVRTGANLGNALVSLDAEVTGRIGWNLSGFGVRSIAPPAPPPPPPLAWADRTNALGGAEWLASGNLFARARLRAVAHNITLDGNSFVKNDIRIDRRALVPEIAAGVEATLGRVSLSFQFVRRGSEFKSWRGRAAPAQEFGAITIALALGN